MEVQPYLFFEGRCEEALDFYRGALGAEVTALMRFKDSPDPPPPGMVPPGSDDKVMHAEFRIGGATLMASDGRCSGQPRFGGVSLSVSAPDEAAADRIFAALAAEGGPPERLMIDSTHLKAHRTTASFLKKGLFPVVSAEPRAA